MALIVTLMATVLMAALGAALLLTTTVEIAITRNFRSGIEALDVADATLELAMSELLTVPDWNPLLDGSARSAFVDGPPGGMRVLPGGGTLDLGALLNTANCGKTTACSAAETSAVTLERPWGANNPQWQLFASGGMSVLVPNVSTPFYVVVLVGDDPSENDDDPLRDGVSQANPGSGVLALRAEAFGPWATHKTIDVTVARTDHCESTRGNSDQQARDERGPCADQGDVHTDVGPTHVRMLSWREVR